jgi:lysozyme
MLPPVVDIEYSGNCSTRPSVDAMARELDAFIGPVEAAFGRPVMLYVMGDALETYREAIPQRVHWVRWLAMEPWEPGWAFWQYHDRGHVAGIDGEVDLNVFSGSVADLAALLR